MAMQKVNKNTNTRFHSFGRGSEHVVSLDEFLSSAPYLIADPVRTVLKSNSSSDEPLTDKGVGDYCAFDDVKCETPLTGLIRL